MRVNKDMPTYANKTFRNIGTGGTNVYQRIQNVSGGGGSARASGVGISIRNNTTGFSEALNLLPTAVYISSINYQKNPGGRYATENWQYTWNLEIPLMYPVVSVSADGTTIRSIQLRDSVEWAANPSQTSGYYGTLYAGSYNQSATLEYYDSLAIDTIIVQCLTMPGWLSLTIM